MSKTFKEFSDKRKDEVRDAAKFARKNPGKAAIYSLVGAQMAAVAPVTMAIYGVTAAGYAVDAKLESHRAKTGNEENSAKHSANAKESRDIAKIMGAAAVFPASLIVYGIAAGAVGYDKAKAHYNDKKGYKTIDESTPIASKKGNYGTVCTLNYQELVSNSSSSEKSRNK